MSKNIKDSISSEALWLLGFFLDMCAVTFVVLKNQIANFIYKLTIA